MATRTIVEILELLVRKWSESDRRGQALSLEQLGRGSPELVESLEREVLARDLIRVGIPPADARDDATGPTGGTDPIPLTWAPGTEPVPGYRLVGRRGVGGTGEVWEAVGPGGFPVALKLIRLGVEENGLETRPLGAVRLLRRDSLRSLELMRGIRHAHLLPLFGAWQRDGLLMIGMELADGTLQDLCHDGDHQDRPGIDFPDLIELMRQAARGIDFLNEPRHAAMGRAGAAIHHGDIKPQNLFLVAGTVKVGDFGQADLLGAVDDASASLTPAYAAPELYQGRPSRWSDQYSLAVTYCQLRGGRRPFAGSLHNIVLGHYAEAPDLTMLPEEERPVVARALAKAPEERWPTCQAFIQTLATAHDGRDRAPRAASVRRPGEPLGSPPESSRRRLVGRLGLVGLVGVCCVAVFMSADSGLKRTSARVTMRRAAGPTTPQRGVHSEGAIDHRTPLAPWRTEGESLGRARLLPDPHAEEAGKEPRPPESRPVAPRGGLRPAGISPRSPSPEREPGPSEGSLVLVPASPDGPASAGRSLPTPGRHGAAPWVRGIFRQVSGFLEDHGSELVAAQTRLEAARSSETPAPAGLGLEQEELRRLQARRRLEEDELNRIREQTRAAERGLEQARRRERGQEPPARPRGAGLGGQALPRTATITVRMPTATAELVVRGEVGKGQPDEWYGPQRVIHTPPLSGGVEYLVGAFWTDGAGRQLTRVCPLRIAPGSTYEVDLRPHRPTWKETEP